MAEKFLGDPSDSCPTVENRVSVKALPVLHELEQEPKRVTSINRREASIPPKNTIIGRVGFLLFSYKKYFPILISLVVPLVPWAYSVDDLEFGLLVVQLDLPHLVDVGVTNCTIGIITMSLFSLGLLAWRVVNCSGY